MTNYFQPNLKYEKPIFSFQIQEFLNIYFLVGKRITALFTNNNYLFEFPNLFEFPILLAPQHRTNFYKSKT